jgi:heme/copper-type cytochrome/quinol oxidase subunit 2
MSESQSQQLGGVIAASSIVIMLIALAAMVFGIIIYWKIFSKAGYSGAMSLLMLVPIANIIVICMLAFGNWPILQELEQLRAQVRGGGQPYPQQQSFYPPRQPPYPQQPYQGPRY